jgi:hypothetical protein
LLLGVEVHDLRGDGAVAVGHQAPEDRVVLARGAAVRHQGRGHPAPDQPPGAVAVGVPPAVPLVPPAAVLAQLELGAEAVVVVMDRVVVDRGGAGLEATGEVKAGGMEIAHNRPVCSMERCQHVLL